MRNSEHHLFYGENIVGGIITLDESESHHAMSVLRLKIGDALRVTNGYGTIYNCTCETFAKQTVTCKIASEEKIPKITPELTLLVGLPDKEHFETIVEHATALGVSRIVPLAMDYCSKPWWESWEKQIKRFRAKTVVSMKQCLYPFLPQLDAPATLQSVIDACDLPLVVADMSGKKICDAEIFTHKKLTCLVGPPGGLSADEMKLVNAHGAITVCIAKNRLRTELAATVLCSQIIV